MASLSWRNFRSPDDDSALSGITPQFQSARAQSIANSVMQDQQRQQNAAAKQQEQVQKEQERLRSDQAAEAERAQKEQATARREEQARNVRAAAAAGAEIKTDIESGRRTVAAHEDGAPKFKAGPIGAPVEKETVIKEALAIPGIGQVADTGALGRPADHTGIELQQTYRNDRGGEVTRPLPSKIDPKTAEIYATQDDPVTGLPTRTVLGVDPATQAKVERSAKLGVEMQSLDLQRNQHQQAKQVFEPTFKPVKAEFLEAESEVKKLADPAVKFQRAGKSWMKVDPDTGKQSLASPDEVRIHNDKWTAANARMSRAKAAYDPLAPRSEGFARRDNEFQARRLQLAEEKIRLDSGLPEVDGGAAGFLAKDSGLIDTLPHEQTVSNLAGGSPLAVAPDKTSPENGLVAPAPLLRPDSDSDAVKSAFGTLREIEGLEVEQRNGWMAINKGGNWIASIEDGGGSPIVVLTEDARKSDEINRTIALGETKGVPLYLRESPNRKQLNEEAAGVAEVFGLINDPALRGESGKPSPAFSARLMALNATPEAIKSRVNSGDLSIQHGEAMLKSLYDETLASPDSGDPKVFAKWLETKGRPVADRWAKAKSGTGYSLADQNQIKQDFYRDWYVENRGKPGVTREKAQKLMGYDVGRDASTKERAASALTAGRKMVVNDALGSMFGLAAGAIKDMGAAEMALFGNNEAAKDLGSSMKMRNRDLANFADGAKRNIKAWTTDEGKKVTASFESALADFKATIDDEEDKAGPADAARISAAERGVRETALALHGLSPDKDWPITDDSLNPDKDSALGMTLARYKATADPRQIELYKERLLMSNGRRQFSAEMEKKMRGNSLGDFGQAVTGAMNAGWQELGTELIADAGMLFTAGGSKALQGALRVGGAAGKAERVARLGQSTARAVDRLNQIGMRAESLANPLTRGQKAANTAIKVTKTAVQGAVGEGAEEMITELGADSPDFTQAFLAGALGGVALTPAFYPMQRGVERSQERDTQAELRNGNRQFAQQYNSSMAGVPGFEAINEETAGTARLFVNPTEMESQLERINTAATALQRIEASVPDPASAKKVENLRNQISRAEQALENAPPDRATAIEGQLAAMRVEETRISGPEPVSTESVMRLRKDLEDAIGEMALNTENVVAAANELQKVADPARRTFLSGIVKVATGNMEALTQNERQAIQGARTDGSAAYFANVAGKEVLTDEARAEMLTNFPAVGSLIQTTESQAILEAQFADTLANAASAQPAITAPANPATVAPAPSPAVDPSPAVSRSGEAPSTTSQSNPAELDALEYESYRATNPAAPDISSVVAGAVASGSPISVTMANAAGIGSPEGYTRRGSMLAPPDAPIAAQASTDSPALSEDPRKTEAGAELKAQAAIDRVISRMPSLAGKIEIESATTGQTAGAAAMEGKISILLGDLEAELGPIDAANQDERIDAIINEEIIHLAQFEAARRAGDDVADFYDSLWNEFTPEQQSAASSTYQAGFEVMPAWAKAAETVRMLIQQRADGTVTELTKAFSKNMPERLLELLRYAAEFLKGVVTNGEIPQRIQDAITGIESILSEYEQAESNPLGIAKSAGPPLISKKLQPKVSDSANSAETASNASETASFVSQTTQNDMLTAEEKVSPIFITGQAIKDAVAADPRLTAKRRRQLDLALDEIWDVLETLPVEERRAFTDSAITEWLDSLDAPKKTRQIDVPAKTRAYQILNGGEYPALSAIFESGTKIAPRPNMISLILARRKSGAKLTNREIDALQNNPEYDGAVFQSQFENSGAGKVAREIIGLITARQGDGTRPDVMAGYLGEGLAADEMWQRVATELDAISKGGPMPGTEADPNRDFTETEARAEIAKIEKRQDKEFAAANNPRNGEAFDVADFTDEFIGETVTVDGEVMTITAVEMVGGKAANVVLDDHLRFGRQELDGGETIYLEHEMAEDEILFASPVGRSARVDIPDAFIAYDLGAGIKHPDYSEAKAGDRAAALRFAQDMVTVKMRAGVKALIGDSNPVVLPVMAIESGGNNMIPVAVAERLEQSLDLSPADGIIQSVKAYRSDKSALDRVFAQPTFEGPVIDGQSYLLVDDTLTQGGTFAALADHITRNGGKVVGAVALTGKQYSATLRLSEPLLGQLRKRFGDLEDAFRRATGHGFDKLTESEARALLKFSPIDRVRERIAAEGNERGSVVDALDAEQGDSSLSSSPSGQRSLDFGASGGFGTGSQPGFDFTAKTEEAAALTDPEPSLAQIEAGNYRKGKVSLHGMRISIENARGSTRSGTDSKGKAWKVELAHHYGYFLGTEARDGDHVDVFVGPNPESEKVFAVNQINVGTGRFDEHKVMLGFDTRKEAIAGYLANYSAGWKGLGGMVETDVGSLKNWLENGDTKKAVKAESFVTASPNERIREDSVEARPIIAAIDKIVSRGESRRAEMQDGQSKDLTHSFDLLTPNEKAELHRLKMMLRPKSSNEARIDILKRRNITPSLVPEGKSAIRLSSSPAPDSDSQAAVDAALEAMPPIYRAVFEAVSAGSAPADVMNRFKIPERAVTNILNAVRSRITAATAAAGPEGIKPAMRDGKIDGGRPNLALSTNPIVAGIDQMRNDSDIPDVRGWDEIAEQVDALLAKDYKGAYDALLSKARNIQQMTDVETAAAKKIISTETLGGKIQRPADRVKLAMLIHGYRDIGTETARSLAIRRDPNQTPAERHALFIAEALFTPDAETRKQLRDSEKGEAESILSGWMARVDSIKGDLLSQGIDLDASLARFRENQEAKAKAEADSPRVKAVLDQTIRKLSKREKAVIEAIRSGALISKAAFLAGMTNQEVKDVYSRFLTNIRGAMAESAKEFLSGSLAASPVDMMSAILADLGLPDLDMIDDSKPGFVDRRNEKPRKTRTPAEEKAPTTPLTPEQEVAVQAAWDRFKASPPSVWSTFWQKESQGLAPLIGQVGFEQFKGEALKPWRDRWQTEMEGVSTPAARITFDEWLAKPANTEKINRQSILFPEAINEAKGDWSEARGFSGQGELLRDDLNETTGTRKKDERFSGQGELVREDINETAGTFDLNDPLAVKAVLDAFAIARGGKMDALMEFWRMSILTGPQTHIVNIGSNVINAAYSLLPKRATEAAINALLGLVGQGSERSATFAEFAPMARNLRKGIQLGARNALRSWQIEGRTFEAYARADALQLDFTGVGAEYIPPALGGKFGTVMRSLSFRAMTAADEFMKSTLAQMEAAAQSHRIAGVEEKLTGAAYEKRLAELMEPGSVAWIRAIDEAKRVTFQEEVDGTNPRAIRRLDQFAELAKKGRNMPWIGRPLTFFIPFIDTPLNIFKQAVEMSPIGGALALIDGARALNRRVNRGNLTPELAKVEAAKLYDRARLVQDLTNQTLGVAAFIALQGLAEPPEDDENGLPVITGTVPYKTTRRGERDNSYAVMPPQTIRIGNIQFSYARIEPFATFMASTVDLMVEIKRHGGMKPEVGSQWLMRFKDGVKDKTFLQGVTSLLNAIEDPDRFAERLTANIVTGFIPNIVRQPIREADDKIRDTNPSAGDGFLTAVAKRVGFAIVPQAAPVKTDVWGNDINSNRGDLIGGVRPVDAFFHMLDPLNTTVSPKIDPIDQWIFRYNLQTADSKDRIAIEPIPNAISGKVPGEKTSRRFALSSDSQSEANRLAGQQAREILGDGWENQPLDAALADRIKEVVSDTQKLQRERIRMKKIAEALDEE